MRQSPLLSSLSPPLCVCCRSTCDRRRPLCDDCLFELNAEDPVWGDPPPGLADCVAAFRHDGAPRRLLHAFKFGRMESLASLLAGYMAENVDPSSAATVVPVPSVRLRRALRGFDPATLLAGEVAATPPGLRVEESAIRRVGFGRQRGGSRDRRLGSPPDIRPVRSGTRSDRLDGAVLLVDDVITTGATITACATALKRLGAGPITALAFTRRV